jgi:hypothetical protein
MAGLGRAQSKFGLAAVFASIGALMGFGKGYGGTVEHARKSSVHGHPVLRMLLKSSNPRSNWPGQRYPGYCSGAQETLRRARRFDNGVTADNYREAQ